MAKLSFEKKESFVNDNVEEFFKSPKTSTEEYRKNFEQLDVEKKYATILRWKKYNEKKAAGEIKPRTKENKTNPVAMLMNGISVEIPTEDATDLIEKFKTGIETLTTIIENNKIQEKQDIEEQIKQLQSRLKELK